MSKYYVYREDATARDGRVQVAVIEASTGVSAVHQVAAEKGIPREELSVESAGCIHSVMLKSAFGMRCPECGHEERV